jgi:hypothetical protein
MERQWRTCPCTSVNLVLASKPDEVIEYSKKLMPQMKRLLIYKAPFMIPFIMPLVYSILYGKTKKSTIKRRFDFETDDDLNVGDRVQIRSEEDIRSTLNQDNVFKGLGVMPEMIKYHGKEYRVFKKINRIVIESTGELRNIRSPTYLLEGVFCTGEFHHNCDRSCFILWKREWLKKL